MMFPDPLQLIMIGGGINEGQHADREEYVQDLEQRLKSVSDHYQQLWDAYRQIEVHARTVEGERDSLQNQLDHVVEQFHVVQAEFDRGRLEFNQFKANMERLVQKADKKLESYELMKKLLQRFSDHADKVFTSEFTSDHREKLAEFLDGLPD